MAYNSADHSISDPVSIYDVQQCFGFSYNDIGRLIVNANINKWAKFKPVRWPNVNTADGWDYTNHKWGLGAIWWKADGLCGMATTVATEFGSPTTSGSFSYKLINGQLGWTYQRPSGGSSQPYRLIDFAQYYGEAIAPYGEIGATTIHIMNNGQAQIDWDLIDVESRNLSLSDIKVSINGTTYDLTDFYLGIIIWKNNTYKMFTSENKFGGGSLSVVFDASGSEMPGTWNLMPFFSLNKTNSQGTFDTGGFISMADTTPVSVTFTRDGSNKFEVPMGEWNQAGNRVDFEVDVVNETSVAHTYTTIRITIYGDSPTGTEMGHKDISNTTVSANSTTTLNGYVSGLSKSGHNSYWIVVADLTSGSTIQSKYNQVEDYSGM